MKIFLPAIMTYPGPPRRAAGLVRYLLLSVAILGVLFYLRHSAQRTVSNYEPIPIVVTPERLPDTQVPPKPAAEETAEQEPEPIAKPKTPTHPIDTLIQAAEGRFSDLLAKESHDIAAAAKEYRTRRGRHPPPGFDVWFKFAQDNNAVMVEDFFDQIYHDLGPFWGLPPATMRKEAWDYEMAINVRNHNASTGSEWFWTQIWLDLTKTIEHLLPDMDIALNAMDEPRIAVPWEEINKYMEIERRTRGTPPPSEVVSEFGSLSDKPDPDVKPRKKIFKQTGMSILP